MAGLPPFAWEPDKGTHIAFIPRNGTVADVKWVSAPRLLRLPSDEPFRDGRRQDRGRRDEVRRGAAVPPARRLAVDRATPQARLFRWTFDLAGHGQHLQGGAARRPRRRVPALRRALLHERLPPWLDRRRQHRRRADRRAAHGRHHPLRPEERQERHLGGRRGRPLRRADLRAAQRRCGRRRRLGADRRLSRRRGAQRPRRVRGDRHRQGPGGARPSQQQGAGGLPRQLARAGAL